MSCEMKYIARIYTDFNEKFGIPRQSGLVKELRGKIVFEPEYRNPDALRGLEEFNRIWVIWEFSENKRDSFSPTVRPPRLGGNERMGVFATRSPFRPNPVGLSCLELERVELNSAEGPVLFVKGADMMNGTPIFDIKPYIPYADAFPEAACGFTAQNSEYTLTVEIPEEIKAKFGPDVLEGLTGVLSQDPRPAYQRSPERVYGLSFNKWNIKFRVEEKKLFVISAERA